MSELTELYAAVTRLTAERFPGRENDLVFGEGPEHNARFVLIGEAPGAQETEQKRPFVGKAGQNLNEFLSLAGLSREEIFVTNTVKLRPFELGPTGRSRNRAPSREELAFFIPLLRRELSLLSPPLAVTLGNTPLRALLGKEMNISSCHGACLRAENGLPVFCLYHPAAVIYRRELKAVWERDVRLLAEFLEKTPVSDGEV